MVLIVLWWVLWILAVTGYFFPLAGTWQRGHGIIVLILLGILAFKLFGNPIH